MRIVLLCSTQANQVALANKIAARYNLVGIVTEQKKKKKKFSFKYVASKIIDRLFFAKIIQSWSGLMHFYMHRYPQFPPAPLLQTGAINSDEVRDFIINSKADLVMVSGTSMIKENILSIDLPYGMINLHTGLSPYIKGAPNCTNWCIANNEFYFIGNSVMWIDAGIDSGDLLATAVVPFTGSESLAELHIKVMEQAHDLYLDAVQAIINNNAPRVKQNSIAIGKTYFARQWTFKQKRKMLHNFKHLFSAVNSVSIAGKEKQITTVNLHPGKAK